MAKALPTAENLVMLNGENVYNVYNQYTALDAEAKTAYDEAVSSGDYIDISALKAAYETNWVMVYNPTSAWVGFHDYNLDDTWKWYRAIAAGALGTDATYGTITEVTVAMAPGGTVGTSNEFTNGAMQISMAELVAAFNANPTATAVKFYYKAGPSDWKLAGSGIDTGTSGGNWKEIIVTKDTMLNGDGKTVGVIGDTNIGGRGETYYFSNFYLVK